MRIKTRFDNCNSNFRTNSAHTSRWAMRRRNSWTQSRALRQAGWPSSSKCTPRRLTVWITCTAPILKSIVPKSYITEDAKSRHFRISAKSWKQYTKLTWLSRRTSIFKKMVFFTTFLFICYLHWTSQTRGAMLIFHCQTVTSFLKMAMRFRFTTDYTSSTHDMTRIGGRSRAPSTGRNRTKKLTVWTFLWHFRKTSIKM